METNIDNKIVQRCMNEKDIKGKTFKSRKKNSQNVVKKSILRNDLIKINIKLQMTNELWYSIFDVETRKLIPKKYNHVIADMLSKLTGCLINIKSKDVLQNHITIRAYCGHSIKIDKLRKSCPRKYILINRNLDKGIFEIHQSVKKPIHPLKKARIISGFKRHIFKEILCTK